MSELQFTITNMHCDACVKVSSSVLKKFPGVTDVTVDRETGAVRVTSTEELSSGNIVEALKTKGYTVAF